jgi:peptide chain release factor 1
LSAKIVEKQREESAAAISSLRAEQVGTGDRSGRIRTYNYPQNRVTDHRINLTLHQLDNIMEGDLDDLTSALVAHFHKQNFEV